MSGKLNVVVSAYCQSSHDTPMQYDTGITQEEWEELTDVEQQYILDEWLSFHMGNYLDMGAWVEDDISILEGFEEE